MNMILNPEPGTIVYCAIKNRDNYPCDVLITGGQYESNGRLSNFWYWRRILPDGNLGEIEHGYGYFMESPREYEIRTQVILKK